MSTTERVGLAFRGLVIASSARVAPDLLFVGWLQHAREIGLDDRQVTALLTLGREYEPRISSPRREKRMRWAISVRTSSPTEWP